MRAVWAAELGRGRVDLYVRLAAQLGMEIAGRALPPGDTVASRLHALRKRSGISLRVLAEAGGISPTTIADLEAGRLGHLAVLERLADALGAGLTLVRSGGGANFFSLTAVSSACDTWSTPQAVLEKLYQIIDGGFDLDPCSGRRSVSRVRARIHLAASDDGLSHQWHGQVFMNPPYGKAIGKWTAKAYQEVASGHASLVIGLVPARVDTRWWHASIAERADVWMLRGRLAFGDGTQSAPFPSAMVLWGAQPIHRMRMATQFPDAWYIANGRVETPTWMLAAD